MNDEELMVEYIKVETTDDSIVILAMKVSWDGPYTPVGTWETACILPRDITPDAIQHAKEKTLHDERFFRVCSECSRRQLNGHMMADYCQSCGEQNHGIVF